MQLESLLCYSQNVFPADGGVAFRDIRGFDELVAAFAGLAEFADGVYLHQTRVFDDDRRAIYKRRRSVAASSRNCSDAPPRTNSNIANREIRGLFSDDATAEKYRAHSPSPSVKGR